MLNEKRRSASGTGLAAVVLIYLTLIVLIIILIGQILLDMPSDRGVSNLIIIPAAVILPGFLLAAVIYNTRRLFLDRKKNVPGSKLKTHLMLFFSLIVLMSSIPQSIVSMKFVNTSINTWFSPEIGKAISGGLNLALTYYNDQLENLENFAESPILNDMLSDFVRSPRRTWYNINNANPGIDAVQIFNEEGDEVFSEGLEAALIDSETRPAGFSGMLPREDLENLSLIRYQQQFISAGRQFAAIISIALPESLDETARALTDAREVFLNYQKNQQDFSLLLMIFYIFFTIPLILISLLISFLLSEEVIRPIVSLEGATRKVTEGDYSFRILTRSGDELSNLIRSFNMMIGELENSRKKILQTEKITAWQDIARQLAHELRNPLTPIKLSAERILKKYHTDPENLIKVIEPSIVAIITEVNYLDNLLKEFRDFSKLPAPVFQTIQIAAVIKDAAELYKSSYPGIIFNLERIDESINLPADADLLKSVFLNLIKNACEAIEGNEGRINIQTDLVRKGDSSYCRIRVQDSGSGIDVEDYSQVFNPYFTTKREGSGLGLPIVERIIFDHRGQIWFETDKGHGTTFFIDLPVE